MYLNIKRVSDGNVTRYRLFYTIYALLVQSTSTYMVIVKNRSRPYYRLVSAVSFWLETAGTRLFRQSRIKMYETDFCWKQNTIEQKPRLMVATMFSALRLPSSLVRVGDKNRNVQLENYIYTMLLTQSCNGAVVELFGGSLSVLAIFPLAYGRARRPTTT